MKFKGNLSLEWYQKHKSITLSPLSDSSCPPMLNWVNKDGALFYEIDAAEARGLRPVWTSASDYRVREARPLEFVRRFEFAGNFMAPECKTIATPKAPGLPIDENIIIRGDNLLALNTLVAHMEGREETDKVKCIYIDPPYNTGSAFQHYDDNLEHSIWLTMMRDRLVLLRRLLREDGVIFVQCDDAEQAYLKIMLDEIFGRQNFHAMVSVVSDSRARDYGKIANIHEYVLVYQKSSLFQLERLYNEHKSFTFNDDEGGFDIYELRNRNADFHEGNRPNLLYPFWINPNNHDDNGLYEISLEEKSGWVKTLPKPSKGIQTVWRWGREKSAQNLNTNLFGLKTVDGSFSIIKKYREKTVIPSSIWDSRDVKNDKATMHLKSLFNKKRPFDYAKPEELLELILTISSQPGDLVFDAFGGSGTTFAVAHKMGRRYIGIEVGEHADTLILPRLQKVIAGQDKGGISPKIGWQGGGGFSYYHLGESVLMQNTAGDWVLNRSLPAEDLQRAILRTFDAPLQKSQGGWAYGHNGAEGYLVCLEDADGNLSAQEIAAAMAQLCPTDKPYLLTALCLSASDSELDKLLKGCYPLPYALMPQGGEE